MSGTVDAGSGVDVSGRGSSVSSRAVSTTSVVRARRPSTAAAAAIAAMAPAAIRNIRRVLVASAPAIDRRRRIDPGEAQQHEERGDAGGDGQEGGNDAGRGFAERIVEVRQQTDEAEPGEPGDAHPRATDGRRAEQRAEGQ